MPPRSERRAIGRFAVTKNDLARKTDRDRFGPIIRRRRKAEKQRANKTRGTHHVHGEESMSSIIDVARAEHTSDAVPCVCGCSISVSSDWGTRSLFFAQPLPYLIHQRITRMSWILPNLLRSSDISVLSGRIETPGIGHVATLSRLSSLTAASSFFPEAPSTFPHLLNIDRSDRVPPWRTVFDQRRRERRGEIKRSRTSNV